MKVTTTSYFVGKLQSHSQRWRYTLFFYLEERSYEGKMMILKEN